MRSNTTYLMLFIIKMYSYNNDSIANCMVYFAKKKMIDLKMAHS